jgi:hypothetical protein
MTQSTRDNGRVRTSRPTRPPASYWPLPPDQPMTVCARCACPVPATDKAQRTHREFHAQVDQADPR